MTEFVKVPDDIPRKKVSDHPDDILGEDAVPVTVEGMESWNPITGTNSFGPGEGLNPAEVKPPDSDKKLEDEPGTDKPDA